MAGVELPRPDRDHRHDEERDVAEASAPRGARRWLTAVAGLAAAAVVVLVLWVAALDEPGPTEPVRPSPEATVPPTTVFTTTVPPSTVPEWSGPPLIVVVDRLGDLVAIDLVDPSRRRKLADPTALASSLGATQGIIEGVDLSPDGSTVAFTLNGMVGELALGALFEVRADGSGEPEPIQVPGSGSFLEPAYAPSGRLLALDAGADLVVIPLGSDAPVPSENVMVFDGSRLLWSPAGDRLMWVPAYGRGSPCCPYVSVAVDPVTGALSSERSEGALTGLPYFDADGEVREQRNWSYQEIDVDASGRHAVTAATGPAGGLVLEWWDPDDPDGDRRPLDLDLDLPPFGPVHVAW